MQFDTEKLYEAYLRTGSVHRTALEFSTTGETVRKYLRLAGKKLNRSKWTDAEINSVKLAYSSPTGFDLPVLAKNIGRTYAAVACKADDLGLCCDRGKQIRTSTAIANGSIAQKEVSARAGVIERRAAIVSAAHKRNGHPRGFLGHKRKPEELLKMQAGARKAWADPKHRINSPEYRQKISDSTSKMMSRRSSSNSFSRAKYGKRSEFGEIFFRSAWEANYARYLEFLIAKERKILRWEYEPDTFRFDTVLRGCRSYKPDFKVFFSDGRIEYHEVKGWMYPRGQNALAQMAIYHPNVRVILINEVRYKSICREVGKIIRNWE